MATSQGFMRKNAELHHKEWGDATCTARLGLCSRPPTQEGAKVQRGSQMSERQGWEEGTASQDNFPEYKSVQLLSLLQNTPWRGGRLAQLIRARRS